MSMNSKPFSAKAALAALLLSGVAATATAADLLDSPSRDVLAVARQRGNFTTLTRAIEVAGLQQTLSASGPVTIFAPTDEAFAKLPAAELEALFKPENKDKLVKILSYHVVAGKALDEDALKRSRSAVTAGGSTVQIALERGRLRVGDARVSNDYSAANGVVVSVDRVLIPR